MRAALWFLALFGIAVAVALFAGNNQGTVTLFWPPYRVDVSLNLALLALVGAYETAQAQPGAQAQAAVEQARDAAEIDYLREDLPALMSESEDGLARVKKIVQDLKDFSRLDQSEWQDADLNTGLESTLNVVRHEVKYKAEVVKQLGPMPPVNCLAGQPGRTACLTQMTEGESAASHRNPAHRLRAPETAGEARS